MLMALNMMMDFIWPTASFALTGGPSQPEMAGFTPIGTTENVDLSSGAFNYNLPLLDVGGYPINMSYSSGVTMDQEASWVGLGWNLNPGVLNRNMRGLPDDFKGDEVTKEFNMRANTTVGVGVGIGFELFGWDAAALSMSQNNTISYNSYNGFGFTQTLGANVSFAAGNTQAGENTSELGLGISLTTGDQGLSINPSMSFGERERGEKWSDVKSSSSISVGLSYSTRGGIKAVSLSASSFDSGRGDSKYYHTKNEKRYNHLSDGGGVGSSISIASNSYVPIVEFPKINAGLSFSGKLGPAYFGSDIPSMDISGYFSTQVLRSNSQNVKAYGYLYSQNGKNDPKAMHDFNREKDVAYTKELPNLGLTNYTYDIYMAQGQGVAGMFRPFRSDVGHVYDRKVISGGGDGSLGLEIAAGFLANPGLDVDVNYSSTSTKSWKNFTNKAQERFQFADSLASNEFEPAYFKQVGELAVDEDPLFDNMGGFDPVAIRLEYGAAMQVNATETLYTNTGTTIPVGFLPRRTTREKRNMLFSQLTIDEVTQLDRYTLSEIYTPPAAPLGQPNGHHTGEVTVTRNDGTRYIYGIPAYNVLQQEATFNVGNWSDDGSGLVPYAPGTDNSIDNSAGTSHYYEMTETPPFAHSYLLTSVVSDDYVDRTNDGPSLDDYGTYTKFTYDKNPNGALYKWRTPYDEDRANFNEGLNTLHGDDKGSYIYGEKELFYLEKIETKTHVAIFEASTRKDGHGVSDENGGIDTGQDVYKLDKISLYTKPEYDANPSTAIPIKEVHFVYDYYLCPGVDNNDDAAPTDNELANQGGKLTLREIYFTYGNSNKGKLSAYSFQYGDLDGDGSEDTEGNASYDPRAYNMWSTYKPDGTTVTNAEFPYVGQNKAEEDEYAAQWHLTNITLPSGGEMKINYESNDYAYVQDEKVMQFCRVVGSWPEDPATTAPANLAALSEKFWGDGNNSSEEDHLYTFIELPEGSGITTKSEFVDKMLKPLGTDPIRFNYFVNLSIKSEGQAGYNPNLEEFVSGYAEIDVSSDYAFADVIELDGQDYGYFKFKAVSEENKKGATADSHPVAKASWNWARMYNPNLAYNQSGVDDALGIDDDMSGDKTTLIEAVASSITSFAEIFNGPNGTLRNRGIAKEFDPNKSWVRLYSGTSKKLGGGQRVSQIALKDKWNEMTDGVSEGDEYGQTYTYELEDGTSSGVATFEPHISKENPLIKPIAYEEHRFGAPNDKYVIEAPYGLSFFPAPKVTYARVEVRSLDKTYTRASSDYISKNRTGKTVSEFYTTKDYPTIVDQTDMDEKPFASNPIMKLLKLNVREYANVSQGYVIELNDMDGKAKSQAVYSEGGTVPMTGVKYNYGSETTVYDYSDLDPDTEDDFETIGAEKTHLDNTVLTIDPTGDVVENQIGVEYDIITDFRQNRSEFISAGVDANTASFIVGVYAAFVPTVFPTFSREVRRYRSAVTTKVVRRYGILRETIAFDNGAAVSTENLAWDSETGEVVLTKTRNQYGDEYFSMNFPAHWTYERMGQAYQNIGYFETDLPAPSSDYYVYTGADKFVEGDEVLVEYETSGTFEKAWVLDVSEGTNQIYLIDEAGVAVTGGAIKHIKIIRSGRRNKQSVSVGSLTMKSNPIRDGSGVLKDLDNNSFEATYAGVIAASATEYSEDWGMTCGGFEGGYTGEPHCATTTRGDAVIASGTQMTHGDGFCNFYVFKSSGFDYDDFDVTAAPTAGGPVEIYTINEGMSDEFSSITVVSPIAENENPFFLEITATYDGVTENFIIYMDPECGDPLWVCNSVDPAGSVTACGPQIGDIVNPFVENVQGAWRPLKGWTRLGERDQMDFDMGSTANPDQITNIRTQGELDQFEYFWSMSGGEWQQDADGWTWVTTVTPYRGYDQDGMERENMDALYRYSAAINGYANTLPIAVAANATYRQIAFDGFEDYDYYTAETCKDRHFAFEDAVRSEYEAHTGRYSMELAAGQSIGVVRKLKTAPSDDPAKTIPYEIRDCECQGDFGPETYDVQTYQATIDETSPTEDAQSKKYVLSYWVKRNGQDPLTDSYSDITASINVDGSVLTLSDTRRSNIIDGWQKVEHTFTIPGYATSVVDEKLMTVGFVNGDPFASLFVDDIRIQPFNSAMKTYVYDPLNLRLMAELDDNNFATFYEYDEEGSLIRIKKETARGIMTIQESRSSTVKNTIE